MFQRCPVCGQTLPRGMDEAELHRRMEKIGAAATRREADKVRRELADQYSRQLADKEATLRKRAIKDAQATSRTEIATLQRKLQQLERTARREAERAAKDAVRESRRELESVQERSEKERAQHAAETARLQITIENLSQKLRRQTPGEMGEMGEAEVYAALKGAFPTDDIQRIGKGMRGADILQKVIVDGKEVGRIIYECKNVATWQNEWVTKANRYRLEYQTPWVIIAARTLPRGQKWFAVEKSVPVIDFQLTVNLAEIVRGAITEIGQLRTSYVGRQAKAAQLFEYILSDHFVGRFKGFAEAVALLREHQSKERQWHSEAWTKQSRLYDEMDDGRREIAARIHAISEGPTKPVLKVVGGS
jgi:uncharacterized protein DUF2130